MAASQRPPVSVVITTRNRLSDLRRAVESCLRQEYSDLEVLVYDDASDDGTADAIRSEWPDVRVSRSERNVGYIVLRNRGFREAVGEYVFSVDDDAYFSDSTCVPRSVEMLQRDPGVGAVAIPFVEPRNPGRATQRELSAGAQMRSYVGCAHAIRRGLALELGGYREFFFHQGEERDLCIRMLDRGHKVVYGTGGPIVHLYSPVRDRARLNCYGVRNTLLCDWLNVPHPYLLPALARHALLLLCYKLSLGAAARRLWYVARGLRDCFRYTGKRQPVSRNTYRRYLSLPAHGPLGGAEAESALTLARALPPND